jgi:HAD superfamily phosphatase (TIGR01681 family)
MINKKKIIFFDGDGTLWYPKSTKRTQKPQWIYDKFPDAEGYLPHLTLTPHVVRVLKNLKSRGLLLVVLSTNPHTVKEADRRMAEKVSHFKLSHFFDVVLTARNKPVGKGQAMMRCLRKMHIPKSQAILIGDSYVFDYLSAKSAGIDCLLIKTKYTNPKGLKVKTTVSHLKELL